MYKSAKQAMKINRLINGFIAVLAMILISLPLLGWTFSWWMFLALVLHILWAFIYIDHYIVVHYSRIIYRLKFNNLKK